MSASLSDCSPRCPDDLIERLASGRPCVSFGGVAGRRFMNNLPTPSPVDTPTIRRRRGKHGSDLGAMRRARFSPHPLGLADVLAPRGHVGTIAPRPCGSIGPSAVDAYRSASPARPSDPHLRGMASAEPDLCRSVSAQATADREHFCANRCPREPKHGQRGMAT